MEGESSHALEQVQHLVLVVPVVARQLVDPKFVVSVELLGRRTRPKAAFVDLAQPRGTYPTQVG